MLAGPGSKQEGTLLLRAEVGCAVRWLSQVELSCGWVVWGIVRGDSQPGKCVWTLIDLADTCVQDEEGAECASAADD